MSKINVNEIEFVYIVFYKPDRIGDGEWIMFPDGVFSTEKGAKEATIHIYNDFRGNAQTKIEKMRILN